MSKRKNMKLPPLEIPREDTGGGKGHGKTGATGKPGKSGTTGGHGIPGKIGRRVGNTWFDDDGNVYKRGRRVWLDPDTLERVKRAAGRRHVSVNELIEQALAAFLGGEYD